MVQREDRRVSTAFLPMVVAPLLGRVLRDAAEQVAAETPAVCVHILQLALRDDLGEESLGEILRFAMGDAFGTDEGVERWPVDPAEFLQGRCPSLGVGVARPG